MEEPGSRGERWHHHGSKHSAAGNRAGAEPVYKNGPETDLQYRRIQHHQKHPYSTGVWRQLRPLFQLESTDFEDNTNTPRSDRIPAIETIYPPHPHIESIGPDAEIYDSCLNEIAILKRCWEVYIRTHMLIRAVARRDRLLRIGARPR
jgi:hypothetical protein